VTALLATAATMTAAALGVIVLRRCIAIVTVNGPSMLPALRTGDRVLVRRARISELRPGQIVVVEKPGPGGSWDTSPPRWPADAREWLIKRVAALPGDPRPVEISATTTGTAAPVVPARHLAVLGDNADCSLDSREIGYVPAERLLGVMLRPLTLA
jgi:signal peptidase I